MIFTFQGAQQQLIDDPMGLVFWQIQELQREYERVETQIIVCKDELRWCFPGSDAEKDFKATILSCERFLDFIRLPLKRVGKWEEFKLGLYV